MDISGLIRSYDSRDASSAPSNRNIMAYQYLPVQQYTAAPSDNIVAPHPNVQHNPFCYNPFAHGNINLLVPAPTFAHNYLEQALLRCSTQPEVNANRGNLYERKHRQDFVEKVHTHSPTIKSEPQWNPPMKSPPFDPTKTKDISPIRSTSGSSEVDFGTEVDTLMKAIQAKSQRSEPQDTSSENPVVGSSRAAPHNQHSFQMEAHALRHEKTIQLTHEEIQDATRRSKNEKKRYNCKLPNCSKTFSQKTHLDIHARSHTGAKPYTCSLLGCGRTFSQLGNLKTHQRRHTGERPFECEKCGKKFAQRGNVRAHRTVHDQAKPYGCRLDDCGKQFTQLGNLKSHQNKFHAPTIRDLTAKFASIENSDLIDAADRQLFEYFSSLYKNSNKGIKGRGKDRKVGPNQMTLSSGIRSIGVIPSGSFALAGPGRGNMAVGVMGEKHRILKTEGEFEMFKTDSESQSGSGSGRASPVTTCFDDNHSDGFEDSERSSQLAFGDRIY